MLRLDRRKTYVIPHERRRKTIQGFHKVIRPGGSLLATTNSDVTLPRIVEMCNRMLDAFDLPKTTSSVTPFCLENGKEILQSVFPTVEEAVIHNALVFHHATPIVNYISSMFPSLNIPDNTYLHAEMKVWLKEEVENELSLHNGIWRDPKTLAIYRCQKKKLAFASFYTFSRKSFSITTLPLPP